MAKIITHVMWNIFRYRQGSTVALWFSHPSLTGTFTRFENSITFFIDFLGSWMLSWCIDATQRKIFVFLLPRVFRWSGNDFLRALCDSRIKFCRNPSLLKEQNIIFCESQGGLQRRKEMLQLYTISITHLCTRTLRWWTLDLYIHAMIIVATTPHSKKSSSREY